FLTAYNIGLNDVRLSRRGSNILHYQVSFWRWTRTAIAHGLLLGLVFAVCVAAIPEMWKQIAGQPFGILLFVSQAVFWCVLWPWALTAFHRIFAERALRRILQETMS